MSYAAVTGGSGRQALHQAGLFGPREGMTRTLASALRGRHIAVTGANAYLGLLSRKSRPEGATVHLVCRNRARGEKALAEICREYPDADARLHVLDVSSAADIKRFVEAGGLEKLQVLINNAGVVPETLMHTAEGNEVSMATAMGGSFLLSSLLMPTLEKNKPSRVINMSTGGMYTCKLDPTNLNCEKDNPKNYDGSYAREASPSDPHGNVARKTPWARGYVSFDSPGLVRHAGRARQEYGLVQFEDGGEAQNACPGHRYCGLAGRGPDGSSVG